MDDVSPSSAGLRHRWCYMSLVHLVLEYAASAWNGCSVENSIMLEKLALQWRIARYVLQRQGDVLSNSAVL